MAKAKEPKTKEVEFLTVKKGDFLAVFKNQNNFDKLLEQFFPVPSAKFDYETEIGEKFGPGVYTVYKLRRITEKEDPYAYKNKQTTTEQFVKFELEPA